MNTVNSHKLSQTLLIPPPDGAPARSRRSGDTAPRAAAPPSATSQCTLHNAPNISKYNKSALNTVLLVSGPDPSHSTRNKVRTYNLPAHFPSLIQNAKMMYT